jgi:hypothetical protein
MAALAYCWQRLVQGDCLACLEDLTKNCNRRMSDEDQCADIVNTICKLQAIYETKKELFFDGVHGKKRVYPPK